MSVFITFEGVEGSGKSLQSRRLSRKLEAASVPVVHVHEPGSTPLGEKLARLLKLGPEVAPLSELLMFNAARAELVEKVVRPALAQGKVVVCDRFTDSTIAYQGYARGLDLAIVREINEIATGGLRPDLTVLLDVPVAEGLARKRGKHGDRFEQERRSFHEKVRQGYLELARREPRRFLTIDGLQGKSVIAGAVWRRISELLARAKVTG